MKRILLSAAALLALSCSDDPKGFSVVWTVSPPTNINPLPERVNITVKQDGSEPTTMKSLEKRYDEFFAEAPLTNRVMVIAGPGATKLTITVNALRADRSVAMATDEVLVSGNAQIPKTITLEGMSCPMGPDPGACDPLARSGMSPVDCCGEQKCAVMQGDTLTFTCAPEGGKARGELCMSDGDCADGSLCGCFGSGYCTCRRYCRADADCGTDAYCTFTLQNRTGTQTLQTRLCTDACQLFSNTCQNSECKIIQMGRRACLANGTVAAGGACRAISNMPGQVCATALACHPTMGRCTTMCDAMHPCADGGTCDSNGLCPVPPAM